jgi:hypothetical protein
MQSRNGARVPLSTPESFVRAAAGAPQIVSAREVFITNSDGAPPAANSVPYIGSIAGRLQYSAARLADDGSLALPGTLTVEGAAQLRGETTIEGATTFTSEVNLDGTTNFTGAVNFPSGVEMTILPNTGASLSNVVAYNPSTKELLYQAAGSGGGSGGGIASVSANPLGNLTATTAAGAVTINMKPALTGLTSVTTADLSVTDDLSVNGDVIFTGLTTGGAYTHILGIDNNGNVSKQAPSNGGGGITIVEGRNIDVILNGSTATIALDVTQDISMNGAKLTQVGGINSTGNLLIAPGGNVGVGVSAPSQKLDVAGTVKATGLVLSNLGAGSNTEFLSIDGSGNVSKQAAPSGGGGGTTISGGSNISVSGGVVSLNVTSDVDMNGTSLTEVGGIAMANAATISGAGNIIINPATNLGISTSGAPTEKLEVAGKVKATGLVLSNLVPGSNTEFLSVDVNGNVSKQTISSGGGGTTISGGSNISVNGGVVALNVTSDVDMNGTSLTEVGGISSTTDLLINPSTKNVGIMASGTPAEKLDVAGKVKATGLVLSNLSTGITYTHILGIDASGNVSKQTPSSGGSVGADIIAESLTLKSSAALGAITGVTSVADPKVAFVAAAEANIGTSTLKYSYDGVAWYDATGGFNTGSASAVAYNGSRWVAVGNDVNDARYTIKYSDDGKTWNDAESGGFDNTTGYGLSISWANGRWVALGTFPQIQYSTDGANWSTSTIPNNTFTIAYKVIWDGARWIAIGDSTDILTSTDGASWSQTSNLTGFFNKQSERVRSIAYNGEYYIAVGQASSTSKVKYSTDCISWTDVTPSPFSSSGYDIAWNGRVFVAIGADSSSTIKYSSTGISGWTNASGQFTGSSRGYAVTWNPLANNGDGLWVATGEPTSAITPARVWIKYSTDISGSVWIDASGSAISNTTNGILGVATTNTIDHGRIGVGTTAPTKPLDVCGDARIRGSLYLGGDPFSNMVRFNGTSYDTQDATDSPAPYTHTAIGERRYGAKERSELILFKGSDSDATSGPDRVRVVASGGFAVDAGNKSGQQMRWVDKGDLPTAAYPNALVVSAAGKVGVGVADPAFSLDVSGNIRSTDTIRIDRTTADSFMYQLQFTKGRIGESLKAGDELGRINFIGKDASGNGGFALTSIRSFAEGDASGAICPAYMAFATTPSNTATGNPERMRITAGGNVGINNTTPETRLDMYGSAVIRAGGSTSGSIFGPTVDTLTLNSNVLGGIGGGSSSIAFTSASSNFAYARIAGVQNNTSAEPWSGDLVFQTSLGTGTTHLAERLRIPRSGGLLLSTDISNGQVRPGLLDGTPEIGAAAVNGPADGFLRLRAGGRAAENPTASYIELTGWSSNSDMNQNIVFGTANNERMRINPSGNVGIGVSDPINRLHLNGGILLNTPFGNSEPRPTISTGYPAYEIGAYPAGGFVGGDDGFLRLRAGGHTNIGTSSYIDLAGFSGNSGMNRTIVFGTAGTERMRIDKDGIVRIPGQSDIPPESLASLMVGDYDRNTWVGGSYFNVDTIHPSGFSNLPGLNEGMIGPQFSIYASKSIWTQESFISSSDQRIKKNISDISDGDALAKLRLIEPAEYDYIDIQKGTKRVYGFIAQQVREHFPEAVPLTKETVPNFYQLCDVSYNDNLMTLSGITNTELLATVDASSNVQVIDFKGKSLYPRVVAVDVSNSTLTMDISGQDLTKDVSGNKMFLYGMEVNDFHTLNKDYLFTINFAATQELDREVQKLRAENASLKQKLDAVIQHLGITV